MIKNRIIKYRISIKKIIATLFISGIITTAPLMATTGTFTATAILGVLITITQNTALNFGTIYVDNTAGSVSLDFTNTQSTTSATYGLGGGATTAVFAIGGLASASLHTSVTGGTITNGTTNLTMTLNVDQATLTLSAGGAGTLKVDGSLSIPVNASSGTYTGSYVVTVTY